MGWFDEQIEHRKKNEEELLTESFQNIARSITGHKLGEGGYREGEDIRDAVLQLLKAFNLKEKEYRKKEKTLEDILEYQLSGTGVMYRQIHLEKGWRKDSMGVLITTLKADGSIITIVPTGKDLVYVDPQSGRKVYVTRKTEPLIGEEAWCFYRPLPQRALKLRDLFFYMKECLTTWDLASYGIAAACITFLGLLLPKLTQLLTNNVVKNQSTQLLTVVVSFMLCVTISNILLGLVRQLTLTRIRTKMNVNVSAATMMRVLSLPASFFKDYSAGELNQYLSYMNSLCSMIVDSLLETGVTGIFSLVYIGQIFNFAPALVLPSLCITVLSFLITLITAYVQRIVGKEKMEISARERGLVFSLVSGIQKIRLAGAEKRAFSKWANLYAEEAAWTYNPPAILKLSSVLTSAVSLIGTIILYYIAVTSGVSVSNYYAFNASYAYVTTAFSAMAAAATAIGSIRPILELVKPLMEAEPEIKEGKETVSALSGSIELSHVSFKYEENGPLILDDLSLTIPSRQYVAIVGQTGCGKTTLLRLLLGFETPITGAIFYDRKDTRNLDMCSVRKKIGTVLQDGKLFGGSIFQNITISDPTLSAEDAWAAAEIAGMGDDIRKMPMGMHTLIQEGAGGVSGGQRQRLMIARAVAPKPKLLFFDEATSALDNITQKNVSDALDHMRCTRIVIAHRLSTIRHCDRILVLDKGKIIEDGTYEELMEHNGFFADLVARQQV